MILTKENFEKKLKTFIIDNKSNNLNLSNFIKYGNLLIKYKTLKNFTIKEYTLQNLYYKLLNNLFPNNSDELFKYAKNLPNGEDFIRSCINTYIYTNKNKKINHKHLLFFSDYDAKRIIASENFLIDCTFSFPVGYKETLIIMYLDSIELKMIPGIFCCTNNKTYEGYKYIFNDILEKLLAYSKNNKKKLKLKTFTTDFEVSLYSAFNEVFSKEVKDLKHIGCFYHYMFNIIKKLNSLGLKKNLNKLGDSSDKLMNKKSDYFNLINFSRDLPFIPNINKNIKSKIKQFKNKYKNNKIYLEFIEYFEKQWIIYFERGDLKLNHIDIKIRTNNCLENYNNKFNKNFKKKVSKKRSFF